MDTTTTSPAVEAAAIALATHTDCAWAEMDEVERGEARKLATVMLAAAHTEMIERQARALTLLERFGRDAVSDPVKVHRLLSNLRRTLDGA